MATFPCPTCQKPVEWSAASVWRPFCSERCRLIDLGAWFTEQRAIPGAGASSEDESDEDQGPQDEDAARRH